MAHLDALQQIDQDLDREYGFYLQQADEWKQTHRGKFVVIYQQAIHGIYVAYEDALRAALTQLGDVTFLIHEVGEENKVHVTTQALMGAF